MHRLVLPALALTLLVASTKFTHAQSGAQKRVLWKNIASISIPKSVNLGFSQNSYYLSLISSGEPIMAAGNIYWNDRLGTTTMQQQVAAIKAYKKDSRARLLSERYLSMGRVWTADFESTEVSGKFRSVYKTRVRLSKAPKGFIESSIIGNEQAWKAAAFNKVFLPTFNSLEVVGLSTPSTGSGSNSGGGAAKPDSGKLQNVSAKVVGAGVELRGYDSVAKISRTRTVPSLKPRDIIIEQGTGVVAWTSDGRLAHYAVYDPMQKDWIYHTDPASRVTALQVSTSGAVAWVDHGLNKLVRYAVYDPKKKRWQPGVTAVTDLRNLQLSQAGPIIWVSGNFRLSNRILQYTIYDSAKGTWRPGSVAFSPSFTDVKVGVDSSGKVSWSYASGNFRWKYSAVYVPKNADWLQRRE